VTSVVLWTQNPKYLSMWNWLVFHQQTIKIRYSQRGMKSEPMTNWCVTKPSDLVLFLISHTWLAHTWPESRRRSPVTSEHISCEQRAIISSVLENAPPHRMVCFHGCVRTLDFEFKC
jgi:hypothetical protein